MTNYEKACVYAQKLIDLDIYEQCEFDELVSNNTLDELRDELIEAQEYKIKELEEKLSKANWKIYELFFNDKKEIANA